MEAIVNSQLNVFMTAICIHTRLLVVTCIKCLPTTVVLAGSFLCIIVKILTRGSNLDRDVFMASNEVKTIFIAGMFTDCDVHSINAISYFPQESSNQETMV